MLWLGALAYGLAIYSTQVYRDHTIETQLDTLNSQLSQESRQVTDDQFESLRLFALYLHGEGALEQALEQLDNGEMEAWLADPARPVRCLKSTRSGPQVDTI